MKWLTIKVAAFALTVAACSGADTNEQSRTFSALVIDGICMNIRSVRSPTGFYCSNGGKEQLHKYFQESGSVDVMFQLSLAELDALRIIVLSTDNKVESGRLNFYVRFFDDTREVGSRALSREKLKELIDKLPESAKDAGLVRMYKYG